MSNHSEMKSRLARVRGLGSAKEGVAHWWAQRLSAVALLPLIIWFSASLVYLSGANHATVLAWLKTPLAPILMVALVSAGFYHLQLGLQVVIEDYVHNGAIKLSLVIITRLGCALAALIGVFSVLRIAFGG
jgi:succinate dehydrogenase / fumarate reductase membrane anchor subunit